MRSRKRRSWRNPDQTEVAVRLIEARECIGLSQQRAAELVGWNHAHDLGNIEHGKSGISVRKAVEFSKLYRVSICWLLTGQSCRKGKPRMTAEGRLLAYRKLVAMGKA